MEKVAHIIRFHSLNTLHYTLLLVRRFGHAVSAQPVENRAERIHLKTMLLLEVLLYIHYLVAVYVNKLAAALALAMICVSCLTGLVTSYIFETGRPGCTDCVFADDTLANHALQMSVKRSDTNRLILSGKMHIQLVNRKMLSRNRRDARPDNSNGDAAFESED